MGQQHSNLTFSTVMSVKNLHLVRHILVLKDYLGIFPSDLIYYVSNILRHNLGVSKFFYFHFPQPIKQQASLLQLFLYFVHAKGV